MTDSGHDRNTKKLTVMQAAEVIVNKQNCVAENIWKK